ncbi:LacI family DNA-binding transcriptional regulator [uncultured Demequina sp.]|uniref:LacI family DNA-binding transcriptional regulator n=1 Tax=uncultured Demequina sp. TaxID=693499 RepID=UPI0025D1BCA4|nr:LacI family DNA-binding transcriptional regulator [uncultured Demequina sp.]
MASDEGTGSDGGARRRFSRPARLVDLAEHSGYSIKTISRVLNNEPYVSERTRAEVMKSVHELGYVADHRARSLRTTGSRSGYVGLIVPDMRNGFFADLANAVEKRVSAAGQTLLLGISDESTAKEAKYLDVFRQNRIEMLMAVPAGSDALTRFSEQVPTVVLDRMQPGLEDAVDFVTANNRESARALTSHLIRAHGLERVLMVAGEKEISSVRERQAGYYEAMREAGLQPAVTDQHLTLPDAEAGALEMMRSLAAPFGVFSTGSRMYWAAMSAAARLGTVVPRDVAAATFDGSGSLGVAGPLPTQAQLPVATMVARAFQLVTERALEPDRAPRTVTVECDIEYGMTCGCMDPSSAGPLVIRTGR